MTYHYDGDVYSREELREVVSQEFAAIEGRDDDFDFDEWLSEAIGWGHVEPIVND